MKAICLKKKKDNKNWMGLRDLPEFKKGIFILLSLTSLGDCLSTECSGITPEN